MTDRVAAYVIERGGAYTSQVAETLGLSSVQARGALERAALRGEITAHPGHPGLETFWGTPCER